MTTDQIHDCIQNFDLKKHDLGHALVIMDQMNSKIAELEAKLSHLEAKLQAAESTARHANNIASCLANGIQPD